MNWDNYKESFKGKYITANISPNPIFANKEDAQQILDFLRTVEKEYNEVSLDNLIYAIGESPKYFDQHMYFRSLAKAEVQKDPKGWIINFKEDLQFKMEENEENKEAVLEYAANHMSEIDDTPNKLATSLTMGLILLVFLCLSTGLIAATVKFVQWLF